MLATGRIRAEEPFSALICPGSTSTAPFWFDEKWAATVRERGPAVTCPSPRTRRTCRTAPVSKPRPPGVGHPYIEDGRFSHGIQVKERICGQTSETCGNPAFDPQNDGATRYGTGTGHGVVNRGGPDAGPQGSPAPRAQPPTPRNTGRPASTRDTALARLPTALPAPHAPRPARTSVQRLRHGPVRWQRVTFAVPLWILAVVWRVRRPRHRRPGIRTLAAALPNQPAGRPRSGRPG